MLGKGSEHAQFLQSALQRGCSHGVAVIGIENQWLPTALADPFSQEVTDPGLAGVEVPRNRKLLARTE